MSKFKVGDPVFHTGQGAGNITQIQEMEISGRARQYYVIELLDTNTLMVPVGSEGENRMHTLISAAMIGEVLFLPPRELDDDFHVRQQENDLRIQSGDQRQSAEVLRDLTWREFNGPITASDKKQLAMVKKRLALILTASDEMDASSAGAVLDGLLKKMVQAWQPRVPEGQP